MNETRRMLEVGIEAAVEAGRFLRENTGRVRIIQTKEGQERNLVSEVDRESERRIISRIRERFPDHGILAEEGGVGAEASDTCWVIDPLDGTTNFLHGIPVFCVTIGVEHRGELVCGVVYDPNFDELFTAEKGAGAFLNGSPISVSRTQVLDKSMLVTGFPYDIASNPNHAIERFVGMLRASRAVRRLGSAALDLCWVAAGRFDGFWEVNLHPWDTAGGLLVVLEAGGQVTDFGGGAASIYKKEILATNGLIHRDMIRALGDSGKASWLS
jgi:myo-inositol-1(or 4)-monophosphatase